MAPDKPDPALKMPLEEFGPLGMKAIFKRKLGRICRKPLDFLFCYKTPGLSSK
jgi:hypothetical protein